MNPDAIQRALAGAENVATGLDFLLEQAIKSNDPAQCYLDANTALIRSLAATPGSQARSAAARLKTKYGKDFSVSRFNADIREVKAELSQIATAQTKLITSENGQPKPILANAVIHLSETLDLAYDSFGSTVINRKPTPWGTQGSWRDTDDIAAANHMQHSGIYVTSSLVNEAAYLVSQKKAFHPVRDYLKSLIWDGTQRCCHLSDFYFGCAGNKEYQRAVSQAWLVSAVARIMRPGCLAKYMIVMEGEQDQSKSKALRALVNGHLDGDRGVRWFRDRMPSIDKDDIGLYMQGVWVIEIAELSAIRGKQWEDVKGFISSPVDHFRRKFGRNMQDYPRQCVFAGTTNEHMWGGDQTGLVRFWPIRTGHIRVDRILQDRDQIWAEAYHLFMNGEKWYLDNVNDALARVEQEDRMPEDAWAERVGKAIESLLSVSPGYGDVSVAEIMEKMNIAPERQSNFAPIMGKILLRMGWRSYRPRHSDGRIRRWRKGKDWEDEGSDP